VKTYIAILIAVIWAVSYIGSVATNNYTGFTVSTPVMLIVATFFLASGYRRNGNSKA
jgi:hypothetical protein